MDIVEIDADHAHFDRFVEIYRAAVLHGDSHDPPHTRRELQVMLRNIDPVERFTGFVAGVDGDVVAAGWTVLPGLDNLAMAGIEVWVEPQSRRRGYGSELAGYLIALVVAAGRTTLICHVDYPFDADETHPYRAFARSLGFTMANAEVHRVLPLPVDPARLDRLIAEAAALHQGYTFVEYEGALPAAIMPAYCDLTNSLFVDAPSGEVDFESSATTPADFAKRLEALAAQGRTLYSSVAFDADGVPAAQSELIVPSDDPGKIFQWSTIVGRPHRGHRLGVATKARNLRWVQALHPDRTVVHTWNAESNTHMIAVNEQLGFVPVGYNSAYQRKV